MKTKLCSLLLCIGCAESAYGEVVSAISASSGVIVASVSGYKTQSDVNSKNFDAKWLSFRSRILAAVGEYQVGLSSKFKATQLMETRLGVQYYPFAFGADFEDFHESTTLRYSATLKPYVHAKVGYGRYLITTLDAVGSAEIGSNYVSVGAGLGTQWQFTQSVSLDVNLDASVGLGMSEIAFSALLIRPRVGLLLFL